MAELGETFDFVIVGAGSAGCVLANRLSEDPGVQVALVEAGGSDASWQIRMPAALAYPLAGNRFLNRYETEAEPGLGGRRVTHPRGRTLGGTSSINGMMFVRGHPRDFDRWQAEGCVGWSWAEVLPYFRRMEAAAHGDPVYRGRQGPLGIRLGRLDGSALNPAFLAAAAEAGHPATADINGADQEGAGLMEQTIRDGVRESTSRAYLRPTTDRPNLTVITGARVDRVAITEGRATALHVSTLAGSRQITVRREVILSAGAFASPQILMLSGIGPGAALQALGIEVVADRPGVGQNLQDHPDIILRHRCPLPVSLHYWTTPFGRIRAGLQWFALHRGPAATNQFEVGAFLQSTPAAGHPDLQLSFLPLALAPGSVQSDQSIGSDGFQIHIDLLRPEARGELWLASPDPADLPRMRFNYLTAPADRQRLAHGLALSRAIIGAAAMTPYRGDELLPGPEVASDAAIDAWLTEAADTAYHPVGTCRMGARSDPLAVTDPAGRVIGVDGLRVVDASLMPSLVSGNTNAATIMIAEKLADVIRGHSPAPALS